MSPNRRAGARVWTTLVAVACAVSFLAFAHRVLAQELGNGDYCSWIKQVWINNTGPALITGPRYFGVVVSDTVRVRDTVFCTFNYDWTLNEYWGPDLLSLEDAEVTSGDVITDTGWLEWSGTHSASQMVYLDKYLHVDEPGWVTTGISETVQFNEQEGPPYQFFEKPFYLQELVEGGDAPSSYNHSASSMTTHITGTVASFPVVWDWDGTMNPAPPSYGFCHWSSLVPSFLGITVTHELDADLLPDRDGVTNIDPASDTPDRDGADDGVTFPSILPHCGSATVNVVGQNNLGLDLYLNAWADWNRDGDWDDTSVCECGISEWVIQEYEVSPGDPGDFDLDIEIASCHPVPDPTEPLWVRVTLSERESLSEAPWIYGGQPYPASTACFWEGETEDYLVEPELIPECGWEKQVYINDELAGEWDEGPFAVAVSDTVTISDSLTCNFGFDWDLAEEWEEPYLSLVNYSLAQGTVISDTGLFEWSGPDAPPGYDPPGIPVTLTKTLHVAEPGFHTMLITETVSFSPEGLLEPKQRTIQLVELVEGGDAPSSHNHAGPTTMETYPGSGVSAQYPVVWDWDGTLGAGPVTGYYGFCHYSPVTAYLGSPPSFELDADLVPDQDLVTNIDPFSNAPDRDLYDDGVTFPGGFPRCAPVAVQFTGHNSSGAALYLNAWADWNRDGDWEDGSLCSCGDDEWAIQDYAISTSIFSESTPITPCHTSDPTEPLWVRVTLSEKPLQPAGVPWVYGGQPYPATEGCFEIGETEDFLFRQRVSYQPLVMKRY
jgi:hypothetical protein